MRLTAGWAVLADVSPRQISHDHGWNENKEGLEVSSVLLFYGKRQNISMGSGLFDWYNENELYEGYQRTDIRLS